MLPLQKEVEKNEDTMNLKHAKSLASDVCKWQKAGTSCRTLWGEGKRLKPPRIPYPGLRPGSKIPPASLA
jgi:hypothetical protein